MKNTELSNLVYKIGNKQDKSAFKQIFDYFAPRIIGYLVSSGSNVLDNFVITFSPLYTYAICGPAPNILTFDVVFAVLIS